MSGGSGDDTGEAGGARGAGETAPPRPRSGGGRGKPVNRRSVARLAAVQALYQMDVTGGRASDVAEEFVLYRLDDEIDGVRLGDADLPWFRAVLAGVVQDQRAIDRAIDTALAEGWPLRRIDLTLRAVLRAGVFELKHRREVPGAVAITEYVEVAKAFFGEDEPRIVNAVLDRIGRELRPDELGRRDPGEGRSAP